MWRRTLAALLWTALLVVTVVVVAFVTLMGDCPERVIYNWYGGTACSDLKRFVAWSIVIGFPLLWLLGTVGIFRFRSR